nr:histidinol-phosphatase [uncultured Arsenicibacter sp.]
MKQLLTLLCLLGTTPALLAQHWYKGNLHTHSLWSDGDEYPEMIMNWYKANGYHFVSLSDHNVLQEGEKWITVPHQKDRRLVFERYLQTFGPDWVTYRKGPNDTLKVRLKNLSDYRGHFDEQDKFLILKSEEMSTGYQGKPIHINVTNIQNLIRPLPGNSVAEVMQNNIDLVVAQRRLTGQPMFTHINHPNFYYAITANDLMQLKHERFFEVFNGHPLVNNYGDATREGTESMWDKINARFQQNGQPPMFGLATDDSHNYSLFGPTYSNSGRGWVMVNAPELSPKALIEAMEAGRFYATTGVELKQLPQQNGSLVVRVKATPKTSYTIQFIGLRKGKEQVEILREVTDTTAAYTLPDDVWFVRAKIISDTPKFNPYTPGDVETAWTQPVFRAVYPKILTGITPLPQAHAHNDYEQYRPLFDALEHGFTSVEADVHLINDTLYVAHDRPTFANPAKTLGNLYLQPLTERIKQQQGQVFAGYTGPFYLWIDAKTEAEATYLAIEKALKPYKALLQQSHTTVILSGNRPMETMKKARNQILTIDGRPADLGKGVKPALMPMISDAYPNQVKWRGQGEMPADEFMKLKQLAGQTHKEGKKLRLWATPENPAVWVKLREAGVDLLNTDQLDLLKEFLEK